MNKLLSTYKQTDQEIKTIHRLCYNTVGSEKIRKRYLKEFSGSLVCFCPKRGLRVHAWLGKGFVIYAPLYNDRNLKGR